MILGKTLSREFGSPRNFSSVGTSGNDEHQWLSTDPIRAHAFAPGLLSGCRSSQASPKYISKSKDLELEDQLLTGEDGTKHSDAYLKYKIGRKGSINYNPPFLAELKYLYSDVIDEHESMVFSRKSSRPKYCAPILSHDSDSDTPFGNLENGETIPNLDVKSGPEQDEDLASFKSFRESQRRSTRLMKKPWKCFRPTKLRDSPFNTGPEALSNAQGDPTPRMSITSSGTESEDSRISLKHPEKKNPPVYIPAQSLSDISGLEEHIRSLKEMVLWPLKHRILFSQWNISMPKGVLFHGPPGTGKTMLARAIISECNNLDPTGGRSVLSRDAIPKVSFFMKSSSEILSKWIGEAEKTLKKLFETAKKNAPSILFFDELDGLAPKRTCKQDQSHVSLVSTLLTLMDGLEDRGHVVVIGATNRIEALDPALRRPGRFDKELFFGLPNGPVRRDMLVKFAQRHHYSFEEDSEDLDFLVAKSEGFCGADIKAMCTEAALCAVRRLGEEGLSAIDPQHIPNLDISSQDWKATLDRFASISKRHGFGAKEDTHQNSGLHVRLNALSWISDAFEEKLELVSSFPNIIFRLSELAIFEQCLLSFVEKKRSQGKDIELISLDVQKLLETPDQSYTNVLNPSLSIQMPWTPEARLVNYLCSHKKCAQTLHLYYIPSIGSWQKSLKGTQCWSILKHFLLKNDDLTLNYKIVATSKNELKHSTEVLFAIYDVDLKNKKIS